ILHFGQGKWYPGEPIPRWQYAMLWRKDQQPLWINNELFADPIQKGTTTLDQSRQFIDQLALNLGLTQKYVIDAYEDKMYYEWEAQNLPKNFDEERDLQSAKIERKKLLEILKKGMDKPVGFVLPLKKEIDANVWKSCPWEFSRDKLYLIPGNSQIGYRLPIDRLIKVEKGVDEIVVPADPLQKISDLLNRSEMQMIVEKRKKTGKQEQVQTGQKSQTFTTALCAEIKNGNLHLFLPPLDEFSDFIDLVFSIEEAASALKIPVLLEGYQAPYHQDIVKLVVAPDPGVVEVNIHPAGSWDEILNIYDTLFEAAEEVGLGTNKFMIDGKHTGTGGGNHITLGGSTPADSPLLRRPDLLRSMISFWQNHPGLSYLFSSPFIGPTSQAPRVDEGRSEIIYELEIAFKELEKHDDPPFWMVDRLFRNLLIDITGNTHRAEFCIDKLYNPESQTGRLGILELRGFDMPPHKEMCLVQLLLIRSLVAVFWNQPYKQRLIDWGTDLHNKFMMHHFVREDMYEVIDHINNHGIDFDKQWLDVFLDFRFPIYGQINVKGINLTLRAGIEPWIVLGEEITSAGTSRYVDSSVERLEVLVEDFNPGRYKLLCNYIEVPLVKTNYKGKYVAAVRFKAWAPFSALHPTIEPNSPLVFDIYDTWNECSIGGCTYHVMHPGGRSYDTFPVNSLEAESRRMTRFWEFNHSPKNIVKIATQENNAMSSTSYITSHTEVNTDITIKQIPMSHEFPHTLDLRRG
ncbi:MAG: transglutaminase family protein, partial [Bacteroidia bacterium]|nr:transglutaminase family protein [Bacteroidia bacterium]